METWSVHHLYEEASSKLGADTAAKMRSYAAGLLNRVPVVFSLGHLSWITGVDYKFLHDTVNRKRDAINYRMFPITKRSGGRRFIHSVATKLLTVQQFINSQILQRIRPHSASFAFHKSGGIMQCAAQHCKARWLFQFDLTDFFFSISEPRVYEVFMKLGYRDLLAFEMTRLCTTTRVPQYVRLEYTNRLFMRERYPYLLQATMGILPQGAPTSPMLSNLVGENLDRELHTLARDNGFVYTRYADDITFSAYSLPTGMSVSSFRRDVINRIRKCGFSENRDKIRIAGPGSKKIVLGLLVDGDIPRLSREMYKRIERHLYASKKYGIEATAAHEGFESAYGFYNHLSGLVAFTKDVDRARWNEFQESLSEIPRPF